MNLNSLDYTFFFWKDYHERLLLLPQVRVNKEQDHVLVCPQGLSYAEVTGANLVSTALIVVIATPGKITPTPRVILVRDLVCL